MSKINETNYPRRTQASYEDTDMLVIQESGGNTYTTRIEDLREDYEETLAPTLTALENEINSNLATVETGSTASKNYAEGELLVFNGLLYKATTAIASGASLNVGSNITRDTIKDELSSLTSDLADIKLVKLHSANTITVALSGGTGFIPWSTLDQINRTKYEYLPIVSCNGYFLGICYRFTGDGYTISGNDQTYSGNVAIQVFALQIPK